MNTFMGDYYDFDTWRAGLLTCHMTPEIPLFRPEKPNPFGLTEHEQLFERVSYERLVDILEDDKTSILRAEVSSNTFGEFLFLTTSRSEAEKPVYITFWGMGFHDYRERWLTQEWYFHRDYTYPESLIQSLTLDEVKTLLAERQADIAPQAANQTQSQRGRLFEMLADLTDEDGAWAELDDLGGLFDEDN